MNPYIEVGNLGSVEAKLRKGWFSFAHGGVVPQDICAIRTFLLIHKNLNLEIKKAVVNAHHIDLTLSDDTELKAIIRGTNAPFDKHHQRTFGHCPKGRDPIEGEQIKKWGVVKEAGGRVTMYILQKAPHDGYAQVECNQYGVPTHTKSNYWDIPYEERIKGSPLHMKMDGWWYVDSDALKRYQVDNAYTFKDAKILYTGDKDSKNNYDPCR